VSQRPGSRGCCPSQKHRKSLQLRKEAKPRRPAGDNLSPACCPKLRSVAVPVNSCCSCLRTSHQVLLHLRGWRSAAAQKCSLHCPASQSTGAGAAAGAVSSAAAGSDDSAAMRPGSPLPPVRFGTNFRLPRRRGSKSARVADDRDLPRARVFRLTSKKRSTKAPLLTPSIPIVG